jgi:hypothetical protein
VRSFKGIICVSPAVEPSLPGSPMRASNRSVCPPCSKRVSATSRTAVYGPVRTVVCSRSLASAQLKSV